jgi:hypothetical protein
MALTLSAVGVSGFSSVFIRATSTRPANSDANCLIVGARVLHGPHQGAHISTRTGSGEPSTSARNVTSVMATGSLCVVKVVDVKSAILDQVF